MPIVTESREKSTDRGFFVAETLSDIAYKLITRKLMQAELSAGQKISEQTIAAECGVSRTPVREAIQRLTKEGLLYQIPSSGTYVARLNRHQLIDSFEVRAAIECAAVERAIRNLSGENRRELRSFCTQMHDIAAGLRSKKNAVLDGRPLVNFLTADLSFHLLLLKAAGNALAIKIVTDSYQRNHFFGHYSHRRDLRHLALAWRDHSKIERAIRNGSAPQARRWLQTHIARSLQDALAAFDHAQAAASGSSGAHADPINDAISQLTARLT